MHRFWIAVPLAVALVAPPAFAGKLDSVKQAAKTYIAKKEATARGSHGMAGKGHDKVSEILSKGKKILGK